MAGNWRSELAAYASDEPTQPIMDSRGGPTWIQDQPQTPQDGNAAPTVQQPPTPKAAPPRRGRFTSLPHDQERSTFVAPQVPGVQPAVNWLATAPTPGGLFPLIMAVIFFIFAVVPVGPQGSTRLELIWRALTGGARIPPEPGGRRAIIDAMRQQQQQDAVAAAAEGGVAGSNPDLIGAALGGVLGAWWSEG